MTGRIAFSCSSRRLIRGTKERDVRRVFPEATLSPNVTARRASRALTQGDDVVQTGANIARRVLLNSSDYVDRPWFLSSSDQQLGLVRSNPLTIRGSASTRLVTGSWGRTGFEVTPRGWRNVNISVSGVVIAVLDPNVTPSVTSSMDSADELLVKLLWLVGVRLFAESGFGYLFDESSPFFSSAF